MKTSSIVSLFHDDLDEIAKSILLKQEDLNSIKDYEQLREFGLNLLSGFPEENICLETEFIKLYSILDFFYKEYRLKLHSIVYSDNKKKASLIVDIFQEKYLSNFPKLKVLSS